MDITVDELVALSPLIYNSQFGDDDPDSHFRHWEDRPRDERGAPLTTDCRSTRSSDRPRHTPPHPTNLLSCRVSKR